MIGSEPASVFEDRETTGDWRVEKFDEDGGCEVQVFTDPAARQQAIAYAKTRYGTYVEKRHGALPAVKFAGPPATLGRTAAAHARLIVRCRDYQSCNNR